MGSCHVFGLGGAERLEAGHEEQVNAIGSGEPATRRGSGLQLSGGPDHVIPPRRSARTHVLNLLHRLIDGKVVGGPPLDTPQGLALHLEPKANVERYDGLRSQITRQATTFKLLFQIETIVSRHLLAGFSLCFRHRAPLASDFSFTRHDLRMRREPPLTALAATPHPAT